MQQVSRVYEFCYAFHLVYICIPTPYLSAHGAHAAGKQGVRILAMYFIGVYVHLDSLYEFKHPTYLNIIAMPGMKGGRICYVFHWCICEF